MLFLGELVHNGAQMRTSLALDLSKEFFPDLQAKATNLIGTVTNFLNFD